MQGNCEVQKHENKRGISALHFHQTENLSLLSVKAISTMLYAMTGKERQQLRLWKVVEKISWTCI